MSMNVFISAERTVIFVKKDGTLGTDVQCIKFDAIQTPTKVTYKIVENDRPRDAYVDYVKTLSRPEKEPVFAEDDIFGERDPIEFRMYDWTEDHIGLLNEWIDQVEAVGYNVKFKVM